VIDKLTVGYIGLGLMASRSLAISSRQAFRWVCHNRSRERWMSWLTRGRKRLFRRLKWPCRWMWFSPTCRTPPDVEKVALGKGA